MGAKNRTGDTLGAACVPHLIQLKRRAAPPAAI
jgi:hypothetical protein